MIESFPMMTAIPDAEMTMAMHRATGLPVMKAKEFIVTAKLELVRRILEGCQVQRGQTFVTLHDPIEDDPAVGKIVREVLERTCLELEAAHAHDRPRGLCYLIWRTAQERLLHELALVGYSPTHKLYASLETFESGSSDAGLRLASARPRECLC